ncbi:MAG: S26 family signal peptidase [Nitrosomonas sp.]|uniref:Conjugal transfer pilin signal peptidase TrbI n=1 Tax=Nitrosomonas aestuarii TaxID=52441 RepID=A0A1I4CZ66_9PROT|nr:S26 family signal peptidase [Nitrosomonas aestuarii]MBX3630286.1 S26 family signal peptidase [Nitrosomonas sp.]SFK85236.1 conjugal transfer pilin signal peptidase TrbI [Nitrosomonas aestuarii]
MLDRLYTHFVKYFPAYLWFLAGIVIFGRYYMLTINVSDSLPGTFYLIEKGVMPDKGELAGFVYTNDWPHTAGTIFVKTIRGIPGSKVTIDGRHFNVDGIYAGHAKPFSKQGRSLEIGMIGIIPENHYYMSAPHPDSLDSRYALVGWVSKDRIIGRAIQLF